MPETSAWPAAATYPEYAFYGSGFPLQNGGVIADDGSFPTRNVVFGNAIANAMDVIRHEGAGLADYNLDGDRGYGWKAWKTKEDVHDRHVAGRYYVATSATTRKSK